MLVDGFDEALVARAQEGDLGAFDLLAAMIRPSLQRVANEVLNDAGFADDLVQETLLASYKNLDQLDDPGFFRPWIMAILRRRAWRWNQEAKPQPLELNELDRLLMRQSRELARAAGERMAARFAMECLAEDDRELIKMAAIDGLSAREMCEATGLTETTVKWRLHEARRRARLVLEEEE